MTSTHENHIDVAVLGGGPAGVAAAVGLAQAGARVALIERNPHPGFKPGEIIEATIYPALAKLGLESDFKALGFPALAGSVSAWDTKEPLENPGFLNPLGHGVLLDRVDFENWLIDAAHANGVQVHLGITNILISRDRDHWLVEVSASISFVAGLIIEATGRSAGRVAPKSRRFSDRLICLLAYPPAPPELEDRRLYVEAAADGWWYAALLPNRRLVVAFVTDPVVLAQRAPKDRAAWFWGGFETTQLIRNFAGDLKDVRSSLRGFPAGSSIRDSIDGPGWVAIGDAAATYDPLSGCGVPMALLKGSAIARLIGSNSKAELATRRYAETERQTFEEYLTGQRTTYLRAAGTRNSSFWSSWR